jgi:copper transport protein
VVIHRTLAALGLALAALLVAPALAAAHATLESTQPTRGARLAGAPRQVVLRFDEAVDVALGAVKVFDASGREVQQGAVFHPGGRGAQVAVRLPGELPDGGYTVTYRVVSADAHPVSGGMTFSVGDGPAGSASVAELLRGQTTGPVTSTAFAVVRAVQYAAIALGTGTLVFLLACWLPGLAAVAGAGAGWAAATEAFARRVRTLVAGAAVAGALSAAAGVVLQGAVSEGRSLWAAARADVVADVLGTRFGAVWAVAVVLWLVVGGWTLARPSAFPALRLVAVGADGLALPSTPVSLLALGVPLAMLTLLPALSGHPSVQSPVALLLPANVLHVAAMAAWLGGIAVLVLAVRAATGRLDAADRPRLLIAVVARFSTLAGIAFAVLFATGAIQAVVEVASVSALLDTAFGRAVLIKLVVFGALVALGWANRAHVLPALRAAGESPARAGLLLRRTLRAELLLGVAVLAVTGALAGYPPSTAVSSGPVTREATIGPAHLELTADPATVGPNELHLYLFDHHTGAQYTRAKEVTVTAALPGKGIAAIPFEVHSAGPGHAIATGTFGVAGDWKVTVSLRVSDFDEHVTHLTLPIS